MAGQLSRPIVSGMDVCDVSGDKIGSVARSHRVSGRPDPVTGSVPDEVLEVKTGFLGFGKRLFVPMSVVQEVLAESVFLARSRGELKSLGYHEKPAYLLNA